MGACASSQSGPNPDKIDLSHFKLLKVVGKGAFGKVNAVVNKNDTKQANLLAMKRLQKDGILRNKIYLEMVWIERKVMALCRESSFLTPLCHSFQNEEELFLVMPFLRGGDLRFYLEENGKMAIEQVKFYAAELICGLEDLHARHILYRDLKPENVLLDDEGHIHISDFGLCVFLKQENEFQVRQGAGTIGYQSPEVCNRQLYGLEAGENSAQLNRRYLPQFWCVLTVLPLILYAFFP
jgi:serine/threonine protein kinase